MAPGTGEVEGFAVGLAHLKEHQGAAAVQVDAHPVPTHGLPGQVGLRPLMIEPSAALHAFLFALYAHGTAHR